MDCLYVQVLQKYGILFTIVVIVIMTILMYKLYKEEQWFLLVTMAVLAIHGMIDDLILPLYYNTFWLLLGMLFVDRGVTFKASHSGIGDKTGLKLSIR